MKAKTFFTLIILMVLLCVQPLSVLAETESPSATSLDDVLRAVQEKYDSTSDITATFTQETYSNSDSEPVMATGKVYFRRGGKMRWEYEKPEPQIIVTNNDDVYIFEKNANQVMIIPRKRFLSSEISRAFFFGKGSIRHYFDVTIDTECTLTPESWCLRLVPRQGNSNLREMRLIIDPRSHVIQEMWITDELSSRTHIRFRDIELNRNLPDRLFSFTVPKGVEVYRSE